MNIFLPEKFKTKLLDLKRQTYGEMKKLKENYPQQEKHMSGQIQAPIALLLETKSGTRETEGCVIQDIFGPLP